MDRSIFPLIGIKTHISKTELLTYSKHLKFDEICTHFNLV